MKTVYPPQTKFAGGIIKHEHSCKILYVLHSSPIFIYNKFQLYACTCIFNQSGKNVDPDQMALPEASWSGSRGQKYFNIALVVQDK